MLYNIIIGLFCYFIHKKVLNLQILVFYLSINSMKKDENCDNNEVM